MNYLSGRKKNLYYSRHLGNIIQHNLQGSTIYWVGLLELEVTGLGSKTESITNMEIHLFRIGILEYSIKYLYII